MEKITLNKKEYELPKLDFGGMRKLSNLGFKITSLKDIDENPFDFCSISIAFITNNTVEDADKILDEHIKSVEDFTDLITILSNWLVKSDFFGKMQAKRN